MRGGGEGGRVGTCKRAVKREGRRRQDDDVAVAERRRGWERSTIVQLRAHQWTFYGCENRLASTRAAPQAPPRRRRRRAAVGEVTARVAAARAPSPCRWDGAHLCHVGRHPRPREPGGGGRPNRRQPDDARPGGWRSATATERRASPDVVRRSSGRPRRAGRWLSPLVAKREPHLCGSGTILVEKHPTGPTLKASTVVHFQQHSRPVSLSCYSRSPKNPTLQLFQKSSKSASTTPQRPI